MANLGIAIQGLMDFKLGIPDPVLPLQDMNNCR